MAASIVERCKGVLVGLAAGDRNGGPVRMYLVFPPPPFIIIIIFLCLPLANKEWRYDWLKA